MVKRKTIEDTEKNLEGQIPEFEDNLNSENLGKISENISNPNSINEEAFDEFEQKVNSTKIGENIFKKAEARDGWIIIDRNLMGERNMLYPESWQFMVRPATVEAIRNWSMLDENDSNSIDTVFNEILKHCLSIKSATGEPVTWQNIYNWDRFFFVLLIREYTFVKGESNIEFYEDCPNCESSVKFTLSSQSLMYDMPDESVYSNYDRENRCWFIDPAEYGISGYSPITLYMPTVEKDMGIKTWMAIEQNENPKKKFDFSFIKFLPWMISKLSKDQNIAKQQIRKAEIAFKSWNTDMFSFMDNVLTNISVTPKTDISAICDKCGEEATARLRFPDGVGALFNVVNRYKKFGTK